ncbi:IS110 family transposase [Azospirillum argentinense]
MQMFAGLDWGGDSHSVAVVDATGAVRSRFTVPHTAEGLAELRRRLARFGPPAGLPVAIERPSGLIVDLLLEAGHPVVPIHPNVLKATRPRYRSPGAKSDAPDAYMLADLLRTDGHRFRPLRPCSDAVKALRALVRTRDDLVAHRVALANQLRALLDGFWPGAARVFAAIDSPIALAFLECFPTPESARRLGKTRLKAFLAQHAYCGRRSPAELLARLHAAPGGLAGAAEAEAKGELVRSLAWVLQGLLAELARLSAAQILAELSRLGRAKICLPSIGCGSFLPYGMAK